MATRTEQDKDDDKWRRRFEGGKPVRQRGSGGWFALFLDLALKEANIGLTELSNRLTDRAPLYKQDRPREPGATSVAELRRLRNGTRFPLASTAWQIGQALRSLGVRWSSGPLALAFAGYHPHLIGVLGWFLEMNLQQDSDEIFIFVAWGLLRYAPYRDHQLALRDPHEYENELFRSVHRAVELEEARHRISLGDGQLSPSPSYERVLEAAAQVAARRRLQLIEEIVISEELLPSLDEAWMKWSHQNSRTGTLPNRISELINLAAVDPVAPGRIHEIWDKFERFIRALKKTYPDVTALMDKRIR